MRFSSAITALVVLIAPALTVAQNGDWQGDDWTSTTTSYTYTMTVTKTLLEANATTTMHYSSAHSSYNATTAAITSTYVNKPSLTAPAASPAATTPCTNCMVNSAGSDQVNLAVAAFAGAAALVWGSL